MARLAPSEAVYGGAYAAVGPAIRRELENYATNRVEPRPFLAEVLAQWTRRETVIVPEWLLPKELRQLDKRRSPFIEAVTVTPDDRVEFRPSTGHEVVLWLGV